MVANDVNFDTHLYYVDETYNCDEPWATVIKLIPRNRTIENARFDPAIRLFAMMHCIPDEKDRSSTILFDHAKDNKLEVDEKFDGTYEQILNDINLAQVSRTEYIYSIPDYFISMNLLNEALSLTRINTRAFERLDRLKQCGKLCAFGVDINVYEETDTCFKHEPEVFEVARVRFHELSITLAKDTVYSASNVDLNEMIINKDIINGWDKEFEVLPLTDIASKQPSFWNNVQVNEEVHFSAPSLKYVPTHSKSIYYICSEIVGFDYTVYVALGCLLAFILCKDYFKRNQKHKFK